MPEFEVVWEGKIRETYVVEAADEDEARMKWMDGTLDRQEAFDGEVTEIREVE